MTGSILKLLKVRYFEVHDDYPALKNILRTFFLCLLLQPPVNGYVSGAVMTEDSLLIEDTARFHDQRRGPDPRRASMYSAVLPGMGQVYNRKYWKVPIVYGGFAALAYYAGYTHDEFSRYRNALDFRLDGNPETVDEFSDDPRYTNEVLTRFRDYYRRQRDRTFIWTTFFYALNIVDAAVDAHFFSFDVSDDLGMKIGPSLHGPDGMLSDRPPGRLGVGIRFSLNF